MKNGIEVRRLLLLAIPISATSSRRVKVIERLKLPTFRNTREINRKEKIVNAAHTVYIVPIAASVRNCAMYEEFI